MIEIHQNKLFKQYEVTMYMNEIQYTYKPCKLVMMKSIHETERCILENPKLKCIEISFYKHMKLKYVWIESNTYYKV